MQLLRDNLTLWTSNETGDAEAAPTGQADAPKDEAAKPAEEKVEGKADEPAPAAAAPES
jgi:14-3-3 protein epsilon